MATDLKKVWFDAINKGDIVQINRLLFSTPNPAAGVGRLSWQIDETNPIFSPVSEATLRSCSDNLGTSVSGVNGLQFCLMKAGTGDFKVTHSKVISCLISVS